MFYAMPGDSAQLMAARELMKRGWMFHTLHYLWFRLVATENGSRSWQFFDVSNWTAKIFQGSLPQVFESGFLTEEDLNSLQESQ